MIGRVSLNQDDGDDVFVVGRPLKIALDLFVTRWRGRFKLICHSSPLLCFKKSGKGNSDGKP